MLSHCLQTFPIIQNVREKEREREREVYVSVLFFVFIIKIQSKAAALFVPFVCYWGLMWH